VTEGLTAALSEQAEVPDLIIVDAVRIHDQVERLREGFGAIVTHVHLHASRNTLNSRYTSRGGTSGLKELSSYDEVAANPTERAIGELYADADIAIDTDRSSEADVVTRVAAALDLFGSRQHRLVDVIVGGQYGSEGKGNIAFYLAPEYEILMRVGGPNAGHKVPLPTPYTHVQLPSGAFNNSRALLVIGPGATIDVQQVLQEAADVGVEVGRLAIDPQAMIIEDADKACEASLVTGIGSTGRGGGAAAARRITGRHTADGAVPVRHARDIPELSAFLRPTAEVLDHAYRSGRRVLLEGTQGTALSLYHGFYPHVTSRDTTTSGCLAEAGIAPGRVRRVVMVCRTYPIRVQSPPGGTSGPMSQELTWEEMAERSGVQAEELLAVEKGSRSGKQRRVAEFDWHQLRRASEINGATDIACTFADYLDAANRHARRYEQLSEPTIHFIEEVERVAGAAVSLIATRFDVRSIIDRRRW
jgi:adenylosuccinate synthase